jgi:hypothetical protein
MKAFKTGLLTLVLAISSLAGMAQAPKRAELSGWLKNQESIVRAAEITVFADNRRVTVVKPNRFGNFTLDLPLNRHYTIVISAPELPTREIEFSSHIARDMLKDLQDFFFEFIVDLAIDPALDSNGKTYIGFNPENKSFAHTATGYSQRLE